MAIEIHLRIVGALLILLGLAHSTFSRRFGWKNELARLSLLTRQIFLVHCFFIAIGLILTGCITLFYANALLQRTGLSRAVLAAAVILWGGRLFIQLFVYDSRLWRGNAFNTWVHLLFCCFWIYTTATYALAFRYVLR